MTMSPEGGIDPEAVGNDVVDTAGVVWSQICPTSGEASARIPSATPTARGFLSMKSLRTGFDGTRGQCAVASDFIFLPSPSGRAPSRKFKSDLSARAERSEPP